MLPCGSRVPCLIWDMFHVLDLYCTDIITAGWDLSDLPVDDLHRYLSGVGGGGRTHLLLALVI